MRTIIEMKENNKIYIKINKEGYKYVCEYVENHKNYMLQPKNITGWEC